MTKTDRLAILIAFLLLFFLFRTYRRGNFSFHLYLVGGK